MYDPTKWKLVPIEPTEEMIQAGIATPCANTDDDGVDQPQDYRNVYEAMIGAAPESVSIRGRQVEVSEFLRAPA